MRINIRYGGAVGMLAAAFGLLGPVAVQAGQLPGTSVSTCAGACALKAPAAHLSSMAGTSVILTSRIMRSSGSNRNGQAWLGLSGQRDRMPQRSDRCGWWDGQWRCGDFDHYYYHHHGYYHHGYYHYGHYHYGHYHYGHYHYGHYGHGDFDDYGHYGHHYG